LTRISNSQYIYTAEIIRSESVLTEHSYALGIDALDIVKDDSTNNENKNEHTSKMTYMVYQLKYCELEMDSLSKLSEFVRSEEMVTLDSFLFLITGSPLMT
jgi:hypothetical protein